MTTTLINTESFIVETIKHTTDLENPKAEVIRLSNESSNTEETYSYCYKEYKCLFLNSPRFKITCVFSTSERISPKRNEATECRQTVTPKVKISQKSQKSQKSQRVQSEMEQWQGLRNCGVMYIQCTREKFTTFCNMPIIL